MVWWECLDTEEASDSFGFSMLSGMVSACCECTAVIQSWASMTVSSQLTGQYHGDTLA
jgi:hypothetical protein